MQNQGVLDPIISEDLAPIVVQVTAPGGKQCVLREATQSVAKDFLNAQMRATRFGAGGRPVGTEGSADAVVVLVAGCLFETYKAGNQDRERPVLASTIYGWRPTFVKKLFDRARKISGLDEDLDEESLTVQIQLLQDQLDQVRSKNSADAKRAEGDVELPNGQHGGTQS